MINMLDVLPAKYYYLVIVIFLVVDLPIEFFLFRNKAKKYKRNTSLCFAIIFIIAMILPIIYLGKTLGFVWNIKDSDYKLENYSVVVLKKSNYKKMIDIKGLPVGIYENTDGIKEAKKKLTNKVDVTFNAYDSVENIGNDLIGKKIDVIFLEDSILNMIKEDNPDFEKSIRIIGNISVKIKIKNDAKDVNVVSEPFNVYITGIDTFGDISSVSRSDVNIVMTVNPKTKQVVLTSIPRDYYVELHGKKGSRDKLTHAGIYGTDMSISTIEDLLGIEINYYIKVNFSSFIEIINALDGVEVYSKYSFTSIDGFNYSEGYNKMNGEEALSFARERKAFVDGDRQRGADQQAVIEAIIKKICSKSILSKYDSLLNSIEGEFQTNMSHKKITSLIKMQLNDMSNWNVTSINLDGSNGRGITYSGGNQELYVMIPDWDTVDEASSTIQAVIEGKKLDDSFKPDKTRSKRVMKSTSYNTSSSSNSKNNSTMDNNNSSNSVDTNATNDDKKVDNINSNIEDDDVIEVTVDKKNISENSDKNTIIEDNSNNNKDNDEKIEDKDSNSNSNINEQVDNTDNLKNNESE